MYSAWADIAGAMYDGIGVYEENGEIILETNGHTTEEIISTLSEQTNLSE